VDQTELTLVGTRLRVLAYIGLHPDCRASEIARRLEITERSVSRHVSELERAGILYRVKIGRCNQYLFETDQPLVLPDSTRTTVGEFLVARRLHPAMAFCPPV
jgi:DNA-binding transcriptional ArsR family regulator